MSICLYSTDYNTPNTSCPYQDTQQTSSGAGFSAEVIVGVIFGVLMLVLGLVGLWQGRRSRTDLGNKTPSKLGRRLTLYKAMKNKDHLLGLAYFPPRLTQIF